MGDGLRHTMDELAPRADGRLVSPSAERNQQPILAALGPVLEGRAGLALEIGSGTGQHAAAFAAAFPDLDWLPSEAIEDYFASIRAWAGATALPNLRAPIRLDARAPWPALEPLAAVLAINIIHIAPWSVAQGILRGAAAGLMPGAPLVFYGPFAEGGRHTGEGNARFDAALRAADPDWGDRDVDDLTAAATAAGLAGPEIRHMPSNNRLVCYRRA